MLYTLTDHVYPDEPCWGLREEPQIMAFPDGSRQRRWVQKVKVVRGDNLAYFQTDFGPAEDFAHIPPLFIPSFGDDSVAQLQELAEGHRHDLRWAKRRQEMLAESTLISDIMRQSEENREWIRNRSVIGPKVAVQRNVYDTNVVRRRLKEKGKGVF
jgi:hypothetical protein